MGSRNRFAPQAFIALALCLAAPGALAQNALFVGNSFTTSNQPHGIVGVVDALQEAQGGFANVTNHDQSKGGYTLEMHAKDADGTQGDTSLRGYLLNGSPDGTDWGYVLLQEQSQTAGFHANDDPFGVAPLWDISFAAAEVLNSLVSAHGAHTVFLMTWGYRSGGVMHTEMFPDFSTMQALLAEGYEIYATALSSVQRTAYVAPAGRAFQKIHDDIVAAGGDPLAADSLFSALYSGDDRHPALAGSYLGGCVVYATLTGRDPRRLDWAPAGLDDAARVTLQEAAAAVTVDVAYEPRVLAWGEAFRYPFLARWSDLISAGTAAAALSEPDLRPTAVVDMIAAPVESLTLGAFAGHAGRVGVFEGGRLTVGGELVIGAAGDGHVDLRGGELRAGAVRLAVDEGSHGVLDLRGGLLETDAVSGGAGFLDGRSLLMTGGELRAREVGVALQITGGTWTVVGQGVASGSFELTPAGTMALSLPEGGGPALQMNAEGLLAGTITVSPPGDEPVMSGVYNLVSGPQLTLDEPAVDTSALGDVDTSWELVDVDGGQALQLTITGGAEPVEEADASDGDLGAAVIADSTATGPEPDVPGTSPDAGEATGGSGAGGGGGSGGCGGGPVAPWPWLALLGLLGLLSRRRQQPTASAASTIRLG